MSQAGQPASPGTACVVLPAHHLLLIRPCGCCTQEDGGALLNQSHSFLLAATFFPGSASHASGAQGQPPRQRRQQGQQEVDLAACTQVVDEWARQLGSARANPVPDRAAAAEAMAAVRLLGRLQYATGEPRPRQAPRHYRPKLHSSDVAALKHAI